MRVELKIVGEEFDPQTGKIFDTGQHVHNRTILRSGLGHTCAHCGHIKKSLKAQGVSAEKIYSALNAAIKVILDD